MKKICLSISICCLAFINVKAQAPCQISLSSLVGSDTQSVSINHPILDITYYIPDGSASFIGLPEGVTATFIVGVVTIKGSPSVVGTYTYTITSTGSCSEATQTGIITVNPAP